MKGFSLSHFLDDNRPLFEGDDNLTAREFLELVLGCYENLKALELAKARVGLQMSHPVGFFANFLALLALESEAFLIPLYFKGAALKKLQENYQISTILTDCKLHRGQARELSISFKDSVFAVFTSGTQQGQKAVAHNWQGAFQAARGFREHFGLSKLNWAQTLPLYHVSGLMSFLRPFFARSSFVTSRDFCLEKMVESKANVISLVLAQLLSLEGDGRLGPLDHLT